MLHLVPLPDPDEGSDREYALEDGVDAPDSLRELRELHRFLLAKLNTSHYECDLDEHRQGSITVSATSKLFPSLVVIRDRNGGFISGVTRGRGSRGFDIRPEDLPILRSREQGEVIEHVARYIEVTACLLQKEWGKKRPPPAPLPQRKRMWPSTLFLASCISASVIAGGAFFLAM
jgi:hypothetical protein